MRIKKHKNGNEYLLVEGGMWVRNFTRAAPAIDINDITSDADKHRLISNQLKNQVDGHLQFDASVAFSPNVCIVSDGYDFKNKQKLLKTLPSNVTILGTNRSLAQWDFKNNRGMSFYVVNNPYPECMAYLPREHNYYPRCMSSIRTCPDFLKSYRGAKTIYYPTFGHTFSQNIMDCFHHIDDYRNPICAAIGLAYKMQALRILLFCCDDSFAGERPGAEMLENKLWSYPQHRLSRGLIEGSLHWYANQPHKKVKVGDHSSGPEYDHVPYIQEESLAAFFAAEN